MEEITLTRLEMLETCQQIHKNMMRINRQLTRLYGKHFKRDWQYYYHDVFFRLKLLEYRILENDFDYWLRLAHEQSVKRAEENLRKKHPNIVINLGR